MKNQQASVPRKEVEIVYGLYSKGKIEEAIKQIKILNEKYPNQPLLFNLIGACYKEIGEIVSCYARRRGNRFGRS